MGKLPAGNVSVSVSMKIAKRPESDFPVPDNTEKIHRTIQPDAEMRQGSKETFPQSLLRVSGDYVFVWGVVYYRDGYGEPRFTRFCHRYSAEGSVGQPQTIRGRRTPKELRILDKDDARYYEIGNEAD